MKLFLVGVALGAALYLIVDSDRRYTWQFIERERMTVRPRPRWRNRSAYLAMDHADDDD